VIRLRLTALALVASGLTVAATPAAAVTWRPAVTLPSVARARPLAVEAEPGGGVLLVTAAPAADYSSANVLVEAVDGSGALRRRTIVPYASVVGQAPAADGGLELLVQQALPRDPRSNRRRLKLLHVTPDGGVRTQWSDAPPTDLAAFDSSPSGRTAIVWVTQRGLWYAPSPDGRRFSAPRLTRGLLPAGLAGGAVVDLGITIGDRGAPVIALTGGIARRSFAVLGGIDREGRASHRQLAPNVEGLVHLTRTASGRIGVLIEDTGIEGERGECVGDGMPRRIYGTVREAGAPGFGALRQLDATPFACQQAPARLLAGPGDRLAVIWGFAGPLDTPSFQGAPPYELHDPPTIRLAEAPPGRPFGSYVEPWTNLVLAGAAFDQHDGTLDVAINGGDHPGRFPYGDRLLMQSRTPDGKLAPAQQLDATGPAEVAPIDPQRPALAWAVGAERRLSLPQN
jgi:hypothetical protein